MIAKIEQSAKDSAALAKLQAKKTELEDAIARGEPDAEDESHRNVYRAQRADPHPALPSGRRVVDPGGVEEEPEVAENDDDDCGGHENLLPAGMS